MVAALGEATNRRYGALIASADTPIAGYSRDRPPFPAVLLQVAGALFARAHLKSRPGRDMDERVDGVAREHIIQRRNLGSEDGCGSRECSRDQDRHGRSCRTTTAMPISARGIPHPQRV